MKEIGDFGDLDEDGSSLYIVLNLSLRNRLWRSEMDCCDLEQVLACLCWEEGNELPGCINARDFLTSWTTRCFLRRTVLRKGISLTTSEWDVRFSRRRVWRWLSSRMLRRVVWWKFTCCLHHQCRDDGGSRYLRNVNEHLLDYSAQHSRRPSSSDYLYFVTYSRGSVLRIQFEKARRLPGKEIIAQPCFQRYSYSSVSCSNTQW
jgi:hypothetical protein